MKKLMISMLAMAAMVSCTNEIENPDQPQVNQNEPTPIEFGSSILGVQTKAAPGETAEAFDVGEIMGITMYLGEVPTGASLGTPSKDNVSFTVGSDNTLSEKATENKTMFWKRGSKHQFYAYYPRIADDTNANYKRTAASGSNAEKITVTVPTTGETTDLLMGKLELTSEYEGTAPSPANIGFKHMLSKIKFVFKKDASYTGEAKLTNISVSLDKGSKVFDMVAQTGDATSASPVTITKASTYTIIENADGDIYTDWSPIVIPEASITNLSLTIDGQTLSTTSFGSLSFKESKMTTLTITLTSSNIELTSSITAWADGGTNGNATVK